MEDENRLLRNSMPAHEVRQRFAEFHAATGIHPGERGDRGHDLGEAGKVLVRSRSFLDTPTYKSYKGRLMGEDRQDVNTTQGSTIRGAELIATTHENASSGVWLDSWSEGNINAEPEIIYSQRESASKFTKNDRKKVEDHIAESRGISHEDTRTPDWLKSAKQRYPQHISPQFLHIEQPKVVKGLDQHSDDFADRRDVWDTHADDWAKIDPSGPYFPT